MPKTILAIIFCTLASAVSVSNAQESVEKLAPLTELASKFSQPFSQSSLTLQGQLTQGGLIRGLLPSGSSIKLDQRSVKQNSEGCLLYTSPSPRDS